MFAEDTNPEGPGQIRLDVAVGSNGIVRLTAAAANKQILAGLSPWDAERLAEQLVNAARRAKEIVASN